MMGSQIFGNIFSTFILGNISKFLYFAILSIIGSIKSSNAVSSSFMFLLLPKPKKDLQQSGKTLKEQVQGIVDLIKEKGSFSIHLYYTFTGVTVACYAGYLYTLVVRAYPKADGQEDEVYKKDLKFHTGLVFIALGASQVLTGLLMNRFGDRFNKYRLASFGTLLVEASAVISLVTYYTKLYWLCFICAVVWGCSETFFQSNTGALIALEYKGKLEGISKST